MAACLCALFRNFGIVGNRVFGVFFVFCQLAPFTYNEHDDYLEMSIPHVLTATIVSVIITILKIVQKFDSCKFIDHFQMKEQLAASHYECILR